MACSERQRSSPEASLSETQGKTGSMQTVGRATVVLTPCGLGREYDELTGPKSRRAGPSVAFPQVDPLVTTFAASGAIRAFERRNRPPTLNDEPADATGLALASHGSVKLASSRLQDVATPRPSLERNSAPAVHAPIRADVDALLRTTAKAAARPCARTHSFGLSIAEYRRGAGSNSAHILRTKTCFQRCCPPRSYPAAMGKTTSVGNADAINSDDIAGRLPIQISLIARRAPARRSKFARLPEARLGSHILIQDRCWR